MSKLCFFIASCLLTLLATGAHAESRVPSSAEIHYSQAIGRAIISPDKRFFVYEWMRHYNWVRDTGRIPESAARRMQTWIYRVDIDRVPPDSEYVLFPSSGSSYWLGAFSSDSRHLSFYELDNDENVLKTGVVTFTDPITPKLTWFDAAPDGGTLARPPVWLSNDELAYLTKSGLVRAKIPPEKKSDESSGINMMDYDKPIKTEPCPDCITLVAQAKAAHEGGEKAKVDKAKRRKAAQLPADARLLTQSPDGELSVFERSNKKVIGVLFRKGVESPETVVFENERVLPLWSPPTRTN